MQIFRTIMWVLILVVLIVFTAFNWRPVEVTIWTDTVLETKIPALAIVAFLLGLVPTWLIHRGTKWRLKRRIAALESAARATAKPRAPAPTQTPTGEPADPAPAPAAEKPADEPANPVDPVPDTKPSPGT